MCPSKEDLRRYLDGNLGKADQAVIEAHLQQDCSQCLEILQALADADPGEVERDQQLREACERVRRRVKPNTWQAFWLTTVEDEPAAEVAQRLEMPHASVLVYKHRVTKMIREEISGSF